MFKQIEIYSIIIDIGMSRAEYQRNLRKRNNFFKNFNVVEQTTKKSRVKRKHFYKIRKGLKEFFKNIVKVEYMVLQIYAPDKKEKGVLKNTDAYIFHN